MPPEFFLTHGREITRARIPQGRGRMPEKPDISGHLNVGATGVLSCIGRLESGFVTAPRVGSGRKGGEKYSVAFSCIPSHSGRWGGTAVSEGVVISFMLSDGSGGWEGSGVSAGTRE